MFQGNHVFFDEAPCNNVNSYMRVLLDYISDRLQAIATKETSSAQSLEPYDKENASSHNDTRWYHGIHCSCECRRVDPHPWKAGAYVRWSQLYVWGVNNVQDIFVCQRLCTGKNWKHIPG